MRRLTLYLLTAILAALVIARSALPAPEAVAAAELWESGGYNLLRPDPPAPSETAGGGLIDELNAWFFSRPPTAKNGMTGRLAGKSLLLILADGWVPAGAPSPALAALRAEGARFSQVYRPDWYQDREGHEFALLTGLTPTRTDDRTAAAFLGEEDVYLPFTPARCLGDAGYETLAFLPEDSPAALYEAAGFGQVHVLPGAADGLAKAAVADLPRAGPFLAMVVLPGEDGAGALETLWEGLAAAGRAEDTALCLLTGNDPACTAQLYLWAGDILSGVVCDAPCSELDAAPTLLNLFGADYDARFLCGRDLFAPAGTEPDAAPLVALYGSAYSDWITDRGSYIAGEDRFFPAGEGVPEGGEAAYVRRTRAAVYDRYVFVRRALEADYFRLVFSPDAGPPAQ